MQIIHTRQNAFQKAARAFARMDKRRAVLYGCASVFVVTGSFMAMHKALQWYYSEPPAKNCLVTAFEENARGIDIAGTRNHLIVSGALRDGQTVTYVQNKNDGVIGVLKMGKIRPTPEVQEFARVVYNACSRPLVAADGPG